ncbi:putative transposase rhodnius neglectus [Trichonephila clavipes]|nr:putative transposase rhodnius neglectus [Trichonephila clavipes]
MSKIKDDPQKMWKRRIIDMELNYHARPIQKNVGLSRMTGSVENKLRPGCLSKLSSRAKRMIVRSATNKPMPSVQNIVNELLSSCNVSVSAKTVRNSLHSAGLKARTPRKKPYISEVTRKRRLEFAMNYKNKPMDFWKKVIFSDESKSEIFTPPSI